MNRYEFCFRGVDGRPNFGILYDNDILSACERFLCRPVEGSDLVQSSHGNYFIQGWDNEKISVMESSFEASGTFSLGERKVEAAAPAFVLNLEGVDLSQKVD